MHNFLEKYKRVIEATLEASKAILSIYQTDFTPIIKTDGSPVTQADLASSEIIRTHLSKTNIPITGEEKAKTPYVERKNWEKSWCVDPLDGTKEFVRKNGEFVINIALIEKQQPLFGLIAAPIYKKILIAEKGIGAFQFNYEDAFQPQKWIPLQSLTPPKKPIGIISSRSHYSGKMLQLAEWIKLQYGNYENTNMGSALKFFELVNQTADIYPRFAPTMEWDIAAGQAIYESIGGRVVDEKTRNPLVYNKENLTNPHFIAYNPYINLY